MIFIQSGRIHSVKLVYAIASNKLMTTQHAPLHVTTRLVELTRSSTAIPTIVQIRHAPIVHRRVDRLIESSFVRSSPMPTKIHGLNLERALTARGYEAEILAGSGWRGRLEALTHEFAHLAVKNIRRNFSFDPHNLMSFVGDQLENLTHRTLDRHELTTAGIVIALSDKHGWDFDEYGIYDSCTINLSHTRWKDADQTEFFDYLRHNLDLTRYVQRTEELMLQATEKG